MAEYVDSEIRDQVFKELMQNKENTICFDCNNKNPVWASVNLGVFICFECAGRHRSYGTSISFVRSICLDKWKYSQLETMKIGGNKKASDYFKNSNIDYEDKHINYSNSLIGKYSELLKSQINKSTNSNSFKNESNNINNENKTNIKLSVGTTNKNDINDEEFLNVSKNKEEKTKEEIKVVNIMSNNESKTVKNNKKGKIEKVDFDDFDWNDDDFNKIKISSTNKPKITEIKSENRKFSEEKVEEKVVYGKNNNKNINNENTNIDTSSFKNKKAISSDDYASINKESDWKAEEKRKKLAEMKGSSSISSAQLNGEEPEEGKFE